jgi:RNA polymerase sigma-70 factor, ECF subfamily
VGRLDVEDRARPRSPAGEGTQDADAWLLEQIHAGDAEAGRRFVREHYSAIYRYLLYLIGQPDQAADLTQETFLEGWRCLNTFQGRGSLRGWLLRIARRQFLHLFQRGQAELGLEGIAEVAAPGAAARLESVELRDVIDRLSPEQREVVLLYYLEGYSSTEIARIVAAPVGTVCSRLARAREHLRQELGEDDLSYLNEPLAPMRQWAWLPLDQMYALEARVSRESEASKEEAMERREFLRQAATGAVGLVLSEPGKEVIDGRLTQKVTLAFKATALSDLCDHLRSEMGVHMVAGPSVADEKVTLFCKQMPLRDVMRQLSRPFGYTWIRSTRNGQYCYELMQDLRSQLLEEELRNRDRNTALLALEREMERYRPYLDLSPDEALARSKTALPVEKPLLERLSAPAWGPVQLYFRLTPQQLASLRAGETLIFSDPLAPGEPARPEHIAGSPLPKELARGVLQSLRGLRLVKDSEGRFGSTKDPDDPRAIPLTAVPEVRAVVHLFMYESEPGQYALAGLPGAFIRPHGAQQYTWCAQQGSGVFAWGRSPSIAAGVGRTAKARWAREPGVSHRVILHPEPSYRPDPSPASEGRPAQQVDGLLPEAAKLKATTADVLEALHRATGRPVIGDFYTRLYTPETVSVRDLTLLDALTQIAEAMRLRWNLDDDWLQFRSESYYDDRLKEVPNRLLSRWSEARRQRGMLTLDEVIEIAQLSEAQLDGDAMAEGAEQLWGLKEWRLLRVGRFRPHVRFLAGFTPEQRQEAMSERGLPFTRMPLTQQQKFIEFAFEHADEHPRSLEELSNALVRVDYSQPGWFQWKRGPDASRWVVPLEPDFYGRRAMLPPVRERTREAALEAARRNFPAVTEGMLTMARRRRSGITSEQMLPQPSQIYPTELSLILVYIPGPTNSTAVVQVGHTGFFHRGGGDE